MISKCLVFLENHVVPYAYGTEVHGFLTQAARSAVTLLVELGPFQREFKLLREYARKLDEELSPLATAEERLICSEQFYNKQYPVILNRLSRCGNRWPESIKRRLQLVGLALFFGCKLSIFPCDPRGSRTLLEMFKRELRRHPSTFPRPQGRAWRSRAFVSPTSSAAELTMSPKDRRGFGPQGRFFFLEEQMFCAWYLCLQVKRLEVRGCKFFIAQLGMLHGPATARYLANSRRRISFVKLPLADGVADPASLDPIAFVDYRSPHGWSVIQNRDHDILCNYFF